MQTRNLTVVSDSRLLFAALEPALGGMFDRVTQVCRTGQTRPSDFVVIDAACPAAAAEDLQANCRRINLRHVVVLLRESADCSPLRPLLGKVGAVLPNGFGPDEIARIVELLSLGLSVMPSKLLRDLPSEPQISGRSFKCLSSQERKILALMSRGATNKSIAGDLQIAESTVRVHVRSIVRKTGLQNRTQAALLAANVSGGLVAHA